MYSEYDVDNHNGIIQGIGGQDLLIDIKEELQSAWRLKAACLDIVSKSNINRFEKFYRW